MLTHRQRVGCIQEGRACKLGTQVGGTPPLSKPLTDVFLDYGCVN
jgi:hypothetical protein